MAESQGKNRRVAWFENSVHPALRKAGDELPKVPDQPAGPKPQKMLTPFNLPRFKTGPTTPGDPMNPHNPPSPVEVGNHVIARLKATGLPHEPGTIHDTVRNLMEAADHPKLVFSPGKGSTSHFQDNVGWKLRLNTGRDVGRPPDDLDDHIMKFLVSQGYGGYEKVKATSEVPAHRKNYLSPPGMERMGSFKRGSGGEQWPKEGIFQNYTIYTGGRKETEALARKLEGNFGDYLKDGMSGEEAMLTPHVGARFVYDNHVFNDTYDRSRVEYHNGSTVLGVPLPIHYLQRDWFNPSISNDEAARAHDLLWSIVSPDYYGPPLHQRVEKSMKTWFENSVHPALQQEEFEKGVFDSIRSFVSGAPKPASVTAPKPASVTAPKPASVTAPKPASVTAPASPRPSWLPRSETPKPRPSTYTYGTGEPSLNFNFTTYGHRQGKEFANDAVNTDKPAWATPVQTPSERHNDETARIAAREKARSDKATAWQVAYNKQQGWPTPEEIAAQKAKEASAAAALAAAPLVARTVTRANLDSSRDRQQQLQDDGSHQAGLKLLADVRGEFAPDKLGSLTAPRQWAESLGTKRSDEHQDLKKEVIAMHDRLALKHRYSGVDGEIDRNELGSIFGMARKGGMLPDGLSSTSGYEPTTRTPTAWQSGTGEIIHHGSPRNFVGSQVDPARIGSGSDAGFGLYGVSGSLARPANQYAHQGNGRTAHGTENGEATTPTVHSYEIPKDMKVARIDQPLKLDDDQLGRVTAYLNDVAELHGNQNMKDYDGNPIPRFSVAGLRAMKFAEDTGGGLTFDQKQYATLPGRVVLDSLAAEALGVRDGMHSSHVHDNVLSNILQVAGFDAARADNSADKGGAVLAIHAGGIHKLIHRQSETAANNTHEQESETSGPFLRRSRVGMTPEIQFPETHALMERAKLARGDWGATNADDLVEKHLEGSFPQLKTSGLQNSPHGDNSVIEHTRDGLTAMNTGEGNPGYGRLEGALYGMSNPDDRRIARIAYLFHDVGKSSDSEDPDAQKAAARASDGAGPGEHHQDKSWDLLMNHPDKPLEQFGLSDEETGLVQKLISKHHAFGDVVQAANRARLYPDNPQFQAALAQAKEQFGEIAGNKRTARLLSSMWQADVQGIPAYRSAPSRLLGGFGEGATFGETRRQLLNEMYVDHEGDHHPERWRDDVVNASAAVKSFTRRRKGMLMKSGRDRITSQVRKEEQRQRKKIHKEEQAEKRGVEHEVDHGISAHEDKVMKLIAQMGKAIRSPGSPYSKPRSPQINRAEYGMLGQGKRPKTGPYQQQDLRTEPKMASMNDADPFTKSQKEVLDRMDRWKKKTQEKLLEEEDKLADRIHSDHTGPGVPKFVGKYTHGVKQHEQRLKRVIDKLRDDEEAEVKEEMDDQESECSRCGKDPCLCGMEKSSRKKKKWPSFDVQSHQIAEREGVSEKDADAMLASRGRNHGGKKR